MPLFGRRRDAAQGIPGGIPRQYPGGAPGEFQGGVPSQAGGIPGFAQVAFTQGWQPAGDQPFDGHLERRMLDITRCLFGMSRGVRLSQNSEVLALVAAIPASVLPDHVDHSQDDLIDRISRLTSVEDALAFLQQLTPGERERLARSGTPLAAFADVRTPEEAMARFQSLDQRQRMPLITMFAQVRDSRRGP
jgi:hypothetical protein